MSERDWPAVLFRSAMASLMTVRPFACAQTRGVAAFHMKSKRPEEKRAVSGEDYVSAARYLWRSEAVERLLVAKEAVNACGSRDRPHHLGP